MANKKTFTDNLDTSPVNKFITRGNQNIQTTTEKLREQPQPETAKERADVNADQNRATPHRNKKAVNEVRGERFSLLLTIPQRESLEHIARVRSISINGLIGQFIDEGISNSKTDLEKWEKIKEVLGL